MYALSTLEVNQQYPIGNSTKTDGNSQDHDVNFSDYQTSNRTENQHSSQKYPRNNINATCNNLFNILQWRILLL